MRMIKRLCLLLLILPALLRGAPLPMNEVERDRKIDAALYYYYSGKTEAAKEISENLRKKFPDDPFFNELLAEIIWQELEKKTAPGQDKEKPVDYERVRKNQYLVDLFYKEIFEGLVLTQQALERNPRDSKNLFLRGMLLVRQGGFIVKFQQGYKSYTEADRKTAEGIQLLQQAIFLDPSLCSAKYVFALSKYLLIKKSGENILHGLAIRLWSKIFAVLGKNFNTNDVLRWLDESMACKSARYFAKDTEIDKMFIYQDILVSQAGKYDEKVLPVLEELHSRFPDNKEIEDHLFLVILHLKNKK